MLLINCQKSWYPRGRRNLFIRKSSVRWECTLSCELPTVLAIYPSLTCLSVITMSWTLLIINGVATVTGLPGQESSSRLCLPRYLDTMLSHDMKSYMNPSCSFLGGCNFWGFFFVCFLFYQAYVCKQKKERKRKK